MGFLLNAPYDDQSLAEVALGMARRVRERYERLTCTVAVLPEVVLDRGVTAVEPVLVLEPLEDALGRVALFLGDAVIPFQDLVDDAGIGLQLGPLGRSLPPVPRQDRLFQHLSHRVPVQPERPRRLPNANPLHHRRPADPKIHVHLVHPSHHP